ncbi:TetR/AcrR family transcriptional regulator [Sphaerisporangium dianthi]|uniref:TetR/AcrR family transcriptional regulator n=1 Tax=Sphaerisporangium dianthi TaxID=1436120 RepID=A0ABV9CHN9_9ACTN
MTAEDTADRPLRADARRNRARVLEAAEAVLARDGLSASMRAIAQEAGVGLGTIYRHFPTQEALYQAIIAERLGRLVEEGETLSATDDAEAAFFGFLTRIVEMSAEKRTLSDALTDAGVDVKHGTSDLARDMRALIEVLLGRAQREGVVRGDLRMPELLALLGAACMAVERTQWEDSLRTRALEVLFDGFRPPARRDMGGGTAGTRENTGTPAERGAGT